MPAQAESRQCRRCQRPVEISSDQCDVFEQMHYLCFHYEFEHDPGDPDEEFGAGGCPPHRLTRDPDRLHAHYGCHHLDRRNHGPQAAARWRR